jgi:hypothetical protein
MHTGANNNKSVEYICRALNKGHFFCLNAYNKVLIIKNTKGMIQTMKDTTACSALA